MSGRRATALPWTLGCTLGAPDRRPGPDLRVRLGLGAGPAPMPFSLRADGVRDGGVRLPPLLVRWVVRDFDPPRACAACP